VNTLLRTGSSKTLRNLSWVLALVGFVCLIFFYYQHHSSNLENDRKTISSYKYPRPRHEIRGFQFDGTHEGRRVISIKADRFSIEKKKIGFFRFGLMNEAKFENAIIKIYGRSKPSTNRSGESHDSVKFGQKHNQDLVFNDMFLKEAFSSSPIKRISSIVIEPVSVELHNEESVVTQLSASSAIIRLKKGEIFFKGNVRAVSGPRVLTTEQLSVFPEKAIMETNQHFLLKTPEKQWSGQRLTTDILLRLIRNVDEIDVASVQGRL